MHAFARSYMNLNKEECLMKVLVATQFNDCPLIWVLYSRELSISMNKIHKHALKLLYQEICWAVTRRICDNTSKKSSGTCYGNFEYCLAFEIMKEVFKMQNAYDNFSSETTHSKRQNAKFTDYDIQLLRFVGPKI